MKTAYKPSIISPYQAMQRKLLTRRTKTSCARRNPEMRWYIQPHGRYRRRYSDASYHETCSA